MKEKIKFNLNGILKKLIDRYENTKKSFLLQVKLDALHYIF